MAELENFRRTARIDSTERVRCAEESLLLDMIELVDGFERALSFNPSEGSSEVVQGVEMLRRQFLETLSNRGVHPFDSIGKPFDPGLHEAVALRGESGEDGVVVEEIEKGYMREERLLRPARVVVSSEKMEAKR